MVMSGYFDLRLQMLGAEYLAAGDQMSVLSGGYIVKKVDAHRLMDIAQTAADLQKIGILEYLLDTNLAERGARPIEAEIGVLRSADRELRIIYSRQDQMFDWLQSLLEPAFEQKVVTDMRNQLQAVGISQPVVDKFVRHLQTHGGISAIFANGKKQILAVQERNSVRLRGLEMDTRPGDVLRDLDVLALQCGIAVGLFVGGAMAEYAPAVGAGLGGIVAWCVPGLVG